MVSFVQLIVITAAITVACGQSFYVNSTARDYYNLARRELIHQIEIEENEIASVNARYTDRLDMIQLQQEQLLLEILQVNRTLIPLQALSFVRKQCIQKYDSQLTTYDKAKAELKTCYVTAEIAAASLTSISQSNVKSAKDYANNQLPRRVIECDQKFPNDQPALEKCYLDNVGTANDVVYYFLDTSHNELDQSLYKASAAATTAVQCSFRVEKNVLEKIGQTNKLISDCEETLNQSN